MRFIRYGADQGLSNSNVTCLLQDRTGFIWVGTENGLNRFDGCRFENIGLGKNKNEIVPALIRALYEDDSGRIWVGTFGDGLLVYDPTLENTFSIRKRAGDAGLADDHIFTICGDRHGHIWVGTKKGLSRIDLKNLHIRNFRQDTLDRQSLCGDDIRSLWLEKRTGDLCIATYTGLCRLDMATGKFHQYPTMLKADRVSPDSMHARAMSRLYQDSKDRLWIGVHGTDLEYLDPLTQKFTCYPGFRSEGSPLRAISEDNQGRLWLGGMYNLVLFYPDSQRFYVYVHEPEDPSSISNNFITSILKDKNGNIWLGTAGGGLNCFNPAFEKFRVFTARTDLTRSLSSNQVLSVFRERSGKLWIGTRDGGLDTGRLERGTFGVFHQSPGACIPKNPDPHGCSLGGRNRYFSLYNSRRYLVSKSNSSFTIPFRDPTNPFPKPTGSINSCMKDRQGNLWIGEEGDGLYRIDHATGDFTYFFMHLAPSGLPTDTYSKTSLSYSGIKDMLEDRHGNMWFATEKGLDRFDPATGLFTNYKIDRNDHTDFTSSSSNNYFTRIRESADGAIWVGTYYAGVWRLDPGTGAFRSFPVSEASENSLTNRITTLCIGQTGIVWAGTDGNGVIRIDPAAGKADLVTITGLPDKNIAGILEDRQHSLWISTLNGLCRVPTEGLTGSATGTTAMRFSVDRILKKGDGLPANEFIRGACYRDEEGRFYFGNTGGLVSFRPENLSFPGMNAGLVFTDLLLFNRPVSPGDASRILSRGITGLKALYLGYDQNVITLKFAAPGVTNPEQVRYLYRLTGATDQWSALPAGEHAVTFNNLSPGDYTFELKAEDIIGRPAGPLASLDLHISPPFWKTAWFETLMLAVLAALIYGFYRYRLRLVVKENNKQREIDRKISELSLTALRSRMNPHFIFNSLSSVQYLIQHLEPQKAETYVNDLSRLIRAMLENSDKPAIPLSTELEMLTKYIELEGMRFGNRFDFSLHVADDIDAEYLEIPSMLIQPFVENAIKHAFKGRSGQGKITIRMEMRENLLFCVIEDNGIGRQQAGRLKEKEHESIAVGDTTSRMNIMNKLLEQNVRLQIIDLFDDRQNAAGTRVELFIPVKERF